MASIDGCWDEFKQNVIRNLPILDKEDWWENMAFFYGNDGDNNDVFYSTGKSKLAVMLVKFTYQLLQYLESIEKYKKENNQYLKHFSLEVLNNYTFNLPYEGQRKNKNNTLKPEINGEYFNPRLLLEFLEIAIESAVNSREKGCFDLYLSNLELEYENRETGLLDKKYSSDRQSLWEKDEETGEWKRNDKPEPYRMNARVLHGYRSIIEGSNIDPLWEEEVNMDGYFQEFFKTVIEEVNDILGRSIHSTIRDGPFQNEITKLLIEDYVDGTEFQNFIIYLKNFIYQNYKINENSEYLDYKNKTDNEIMIDVELKREKLLGISQVDISRGPTDYRSMVKNHVNNHIDNIKQTIKKDALLEVMTPKNYYHSLIWDQIMLPDVTEEDYVQEMFNIKCHVNAKEKSREKKCFIHVKTIEQIFKKLHILYEEILDLDSKIRDIFDRILEYRPYKDVLMILLDELNESLEKICIKRSILFSLRNYAFPEVTPDNAMFSVEYSSTVNKVYQYEKLILLIYKLFPQNVKLPEEDDNSSYLEIIDINDDMDLFPDPVFYKTIFAIYKSIIQSLLPANPLNPPLTTVPFLHPWNQWKILSENDLEDNLRRSCREIVNALSSIERESLILSKSRTTVEDFQTLKLTGMSKVLTKKNYLLENIRIINKKYSDMLFILNDLNIFQFNAEVLVNKGVIPQVPATFNYSVVADIYDYEHVFDEMYEEQDLRNEMLDEVFDMKNEPIAESVYWYLWPERKSYVQNKSKPRIERTEKRFEGEDLLSKNPSISSRQKTYLEMIGSLNPVQKFKQEYKSNARKAYRTQTLMGKAMDEATSKTRQSLRDTSNIPKRRSKFTVDRYSSLDNKRLWEINHSYDTFPIDVLNSYLKHVIGSSNQFSSKLDVINEIFKTCCRITKPLSSTDSLIDDEIPNFFYGTLEYWIEKLNDEKLENPVPEYYFYGIDTRYDNRDGLKIKLSEIDKNRLNLDPELISSTIKPNDYEKMASFNFPILVDYKKDSSEISGYKFIYKIEPFLKLKRDKVFIPELEREPLYTISEGGKSRRKKLSKKKSKKKKSKKK